MPFERGYKTWCERTSVAVRRHLGLRPVDPLSPEELATELNVRLLTPDEVPALSERTRMILSRSHVKDWSAATVSTSGQDAIIYNPNHFTGRRANTVMHELAHLMRGHEPAEIFLFETANLALRAEYNPEQEHEADWLAGTLLLPRPALLSIKRSRLSDERAREIYGVSTKVLHWRMNSTGVAAQVRKWS